MATVENNHDPRTATHPYEDNDCVVRSLALLTGKAYPEVHKDVELRYGRKPGETTAHFDQPGTKTPRNFNCGEGNDFELYGLFFKWTSMTHSGRQTIKPPTVEELDLVDGTYLLDICNYRTGARYGDYSDPGVGHHVVPVIDNVALDNDEAFGLEDGVVVGYWKVTGPQANMRQLVKNYGAILASGAYQPVLLGHKKISKGGVAVNPKTKRTQTPQQVKQALSDRVNAITRKAELANKVCAALASNTEEFGGKPSKGTKADNRLKENKGWKTKAKEVNVPKAAGPSVKGKSFRGLTATGQIHLSNVNVTSLEHFDAQRQRSGGCDGTCS